MLRLGVIGCGRVFARFHLPAVRAATDVLLVGACDVDRARRAWAEAALDRAPCFAEVEHLLEGLALDAVLVATPPALHAAALETSLKRGLAVLVEKPMTLTTAEGRRVLEEQRRSGHAVRVGFNRRFRTSYARLRERIGPGDPVSHVVFTFITDARRWNGGRPAVSSPADVLHDVGSHAVDLVAHLAGGPIRRVRAEAQTGSGRSCLVRIQAQFEGAATALCTVGHAGFYEEHLQVTTGGGTYAIDTSGRTPLAQLKVKSELALHRLVGRPTPTDESFRAQLADFAAACRGEAEAAGADARAGFAAAAAIERCLESLVRGGAWCEVPEVHAVAANEPDA